MPPPLDRTAEADCLAVFRHGAPCQVKALVLEQIDQRIVGQDGFGVLGIDQRLDRGLDRGGNLGTAVGPVLAALIIVPYGQGSIAWFSLVAALAIVVLWQIGRWYKPRVAQRKSAHTSLPDDGPSSARIMVALGVLMVLLFSKTFYTDRKSVV